MSATLQDIRLKVRRITKSPSPNQITDPQIDQYVNTFYLWDFPEHLRSFDLLSNLTITTAPNIDTYDLPTSAPVNLPSASIGPLSGLSATVNLIAVLGLPSDAKIIPGSVTVTVASTNGAVFREQFPYNGVLVPDQTTLPQDGLNGTIDYNDCILELNFNTSIPSSTATIELDYSVPEFVTIKPPLYIAGFESYYTQSQVEFYRSYPKIRTITALTYGSAILGAGPYSGFAQATPVLRNNVLINTQDVSGLPLSVNDDGLGNLTGDGTGTVNYLTGAITVTFKQPVNVGEEITCQTVPYVPNRPAAALYFNDKLTLRPVPDQAYTVSIEGYRRPTALIANGDMPLLREWWQLLAMGASLKVFEDRGDHEAIARYMPLFNQYLNQATRKTIVQQTNDRSQTIYTEMTAQGFGNFFGNF